MTEEIINQQIETMENITDFIEHFYSLQARDKYLVLNDNQSKFEHLKNELEKLPNTPPPSRYPVNSQYLKSQYQSWLKWARKNFEGMKELKDKIITIKNYVYLLKMNKEDRKFFKLKKLINQN